MLAYALLVAAGLLAGYMNAIAGAGSLLTLPALVFTGLDPSAANATNRIAVVFQNVTAIEAYRRGGAIAGRLALWASAPAAAGAVAGAWIATMLSPDQTGVAIAAVMIVMLVLSFVRPGRAARAGDPPRAPLAVAFLGVGVYGGFIQAGVGVLILLFLSTFYGVDLVAANALKVVAILVLTAVALVTFAARGADIDLARGLLLAAATSAGSWAGAHAALKRGEGFVRLVLTVTVAASAAKLLYDSVA